MCNELSDIVLVQSVKYVPKVFSVRLSAFRQVVWKVQHEIFVVLHHGPELLYGKLVEDRHIYELNFLEFQQLLCYSSENFLKKILVIHCMLRYIKLP